jgi:predicted MPP superfamily phosphohydrolase
MWWIAGGCTLILIFVWLMYENCSFGVRHVTLHTPRAQKSSTIVHLSDLHARRYPCDICDAVRALDPDLIVMTGDMFSDRQQSVAPVLARLAPLTRLAPCYVVMGNHDHRLPEFSALVQKIGQTGMHVLCNRLAMVTAHGQRFSIAGLDAAAGREGTFHTAYPNETQARLLCQLCGMPGVRLVLDHYPENFALRGQMSYNQYTFELMLAGHAHGGQVRLPWIGALFAPGQGLFPRYTAGPYEGQTSRLLVSRGLGGRAMLPRVGNRPQIVCVHILPDGQKMEQKERNEIDQ